ncbi:MAG: hypothetical protein ABIS50_24305 [Luteolibacter sp.]|uniref:hypothetical protein n=1 Tax=Luteolibacter sp. TaxID=1962973 RepID=UPI003267AEBA
MKHEILPFNPENLVSGPEASTLSPLQVAAAAASLANFETARAGLSHWSAQVKLCARATLAATTMAGLHLRALRVFCFGDRTVGRPKRMPQSVTFSNWETLLTDVAGISRDTGERWMKIADAVEAMAAKEGVDVISICQTAPWDWTPEESEKIGDAVHKLTQDKTQRQLLQADFISGLGYVEPERINGSNNPLGHNGGKKQPEATAEAKVEANRLLARTALFGHNSEDHRPRPGSPAFWMNALVDADGKGELAKHPLASLSKKELRDLRDLLFKPTMDAFNKLCD